MEAAVQAEAVAVFAEVDAEAEVMVMQYTGLDLKKRRIGLQVSGAILLGLLGWNAAPALASPLPLRFCPTCQVGSTPSPTLPQGSLGAQGPKILSHTYNIARVIQGETPSLIPQPLELPTAVQLAERGLNWQEGMPLPGALDDSQFNPGFLTPFSQINGAEVQLDLSSPDAPWNLDLGMPPLLEGGSAQLRIVPLIPWESSEVSV